MVKAWRYAYIFWPFIVVGLIATAVLICSGSGENIDRAFKLNFAILIGGLLSLTAAFILLHKWYSSGETVKFPIFIPDLLVLIFVSYVSIMSYFNQTFNEKTLMLLLGTATYFLIRLLISNIFSAIAGSVIFFGLTSICLIEAIVAVLQIANILPSLDQSFPVTGSFVNPAPMSLFLSAIFPVSLSICFFSPKKDIRLLSALNVGLILLVLSISQIRASWVSVLSISAIILFVKFDVLRRIFYNIRKIWWKATASILVCLLLIATVSIYIFKLKPTSANGRLLVWEIAWDKAWQTPVLGSGYGSFKERYNEWQIDYFQSHPNIFNKVYLGEVRVSDFAGYVRVSYNEYLEIFVEQGLLGFAIFTLLIAFIFITSFRLLRRNFRWTLFASLTGAASLLVSGLFSYPLNFNSFPTFALFFLFLSMIVSEWKGELKPKWVLRGSVFSMLMIAGLIAMAVVAIPKSIQKIWIYNNYREIRSGNSLSGYEGIYRHLYADPDFLLDYSIFLIRANQLKLAHTYLQQAEKYSSNPRIFMLTGDIWKDKRQYKEAEEYYLKACLALPTRFYPKYLLFRLYIVTENYTKAEAVGKLILLSRAKNSSSSNAMLMEVKSTMKQITTLGNH